MPLQRAGWLSGNKADAQRAGQGAGCCPVHNLPGLPPPPSSTLPPNKGMCWVGDCRALPASFSPSSPVFLRLTLIAPGEASLPLLQLTLLGACVCSLSSALDLQSCYLSFLLFEMPGLARP